MPEFTRLPAGPRPPHHLYAVVEIPRGGRAKYEYDAALGLFRLDRVLYSAVHYPAAYGFVPQTLAGDGDPIDILVLGEFGSFTGALLDVRPVGLLRMRDEKGEDEKVLAVPLKDPRYQHIKGLSEVPPHLLREVEHFFRIYKELEGQEVRTLGWQGRSEAEAYVVASIVGDPAHEPVS